MLSSYLLVTGRKIKREAIFVGINIVGLALAIACCLVLGLYVQSELTYDKHNVDYENIYRINNTFIQKGRAEKYAISSESLGPLLLREYPQLGEFVRFRSVPKSVIRVDDIEIYWDDLYIVDDNIFTIFNHEAIYGDLKDSLKDPSSIVISEAFSKQYFGDQNPIGKTIGTDTFDYKVTAVFKDLPENSHMKYSALLSRNRLAAFGITDENVRPNNLFGISAYTYFHVPSDFNPDNFPHLFEEFFNKDAAEIGKTFETSLVFEAQRLDAIHFDNVMQFDQPAGNIFYVYGFIAVAIFVLLVACINYTNLAIAQAAKRAKEVGMRKVIGASRLQLMWQFIAESIVYAFIALLLALFLIEVAEAFTPLNQLLGKYQLLQLTNQPVIFVYAGGLSLTIGLLASIYPAFYMSSISPLAALTATKRQRSSRFQLRHVLVFIQFIVSIGVVASTILMGMQMSYVASKPLGFEPENHLSVTLHGVDTLEKIPVIRSELLKDPNVLGVAETSFVPGEGTSVNGLQVESNEGAIEPFSAYNMRVSKEYIEVMGMEMAEGRDFSKRLLTDVGTSVLVNETMAKELGWSQPIGKKIVWGPLSNARVVGVVKDFHFESLHQPVSSLFIYQQPEDDFSNVPPMQRSLISRNLVIKIAGENVFQTINHIETVITQFDPKHPFEFKFYNDLLNGLYNTESNLMKLTGIFAAICIFISCMGLFGLSAFTTEQRTKEIGVRKVLGASTAQIVLLLTKNLVILVVIAAILASGISYLAISDWLQAFAYRTDIKWWPFLVATLGVSLVAFTTVALQSAKTAQSNPVNSLRYE